MSRLEGMVAWPRVVVKDMVRIRNILEIKVYFGDNFSRCLTDGLDVENKGKKETKVNFYVSYLRNWLDGCVIYYNGKNLFMRLCLLNEYWDRNTSLLGTHKTCHFVLLVTESLLFSGYPVVCIHTGLKY